MAKTIEVTQTHILVLEVAINQFGTSSNTSPQVRHLTRMWRVKEKIHIIGIITKYGALRHKQRGNQSRVSCPRTSGSLAFIPCVVDSGPNPTGHGTSRHRWPISQGTAWAEHTWAAHLARPYPEACLANPVGKPIVQAERFVTRPCGQLINQSDSTWHLSHTF